MGMFQAVRRAYLAARDALSSRFITRKIQDARWLWMRSVSPEVIEGALSQCSHGYLRQIADVYDLMPATDPHIHGVRRQYLAGVSSIETDVVAVDETTQAQQAAAVIDAQWNRPDANVPSLVESLAEGLLRGISVTEVMWNEPGAGLRRWEGFAPVPQQRIRLDQETGAISIIVDPLQPEGVPLSSFPQGKFICVVASEHVPDFASRGVYRAVLRDWYGRVLVSQWEQQAIERYGMPIPVGKFAADSDRQIVENAFANFGAAGSLVVSKGSEIDFASTGTSTSADLVHEKYLEASGRRISVAFLGAEQTATVGTRQGSKASAAIHELVRKDVLYATWSTLSFAIRKQLFEPFLAMNYGPALALVAPLLVPQFDEAQDLNLTATAVAALQQTGLSISESWLRGITGAPPPQTPEDTLRPVAPSAPGPATPAAPAPFPRLAAASQPQPKAKQPEAPDGFGKEIVSRFRKPLQAGSLEGAKRALEAMGEPDNPAFVDSFAAQQVDAFMSGLLEIRKARGGGA